MRKISAIVLALSFSFSSAGAAPMKVFHASESLDHPCKLAKSVGGKWTSAEEKEIAGQDVNAIVSKANGDFSNFKYNGIWYAVRSECLQDSASGSTSDSSGTSANATAKKYYVELKAQKYLLTGAGTGAGPTATVGQTNGAMSSGIGLGARLGYYWREDRVVFLDINTMSASQDTTYAGTPTSTSTAADSILLINLGLQLPFKPSFFGLVPYVAGSFGYAKLTENTTGVFPSTPNFAVTEGSTGLDARIEGGVTYPFTSHLDGVFSLGLTYLNFNTKTVTASNVTPSSPTTTVGTPRSNAIGYSNLTAAFGIRYTL